MTSIDKCVCGHVLKKHTLAGGGWRCLAKKCKCITYVALEDAGMEHEETEYEKRLRQGKRLGIKIREAGTVSTREEQDIIDFNTDKIRKENDLLMVPEDKLTWYQKVQRNNILDVIEDQEWVNKVRESIAYTKANRKLAR